MVVMSPPPRREDDAVLAQQLTERLLGGLGTAQREYRTEKLEIFTPDVELAVEQFDFQLAFYRETGRAFPCLTPDTGTHPCPINLIPNILPWTDFRPPFLYHLYELSSNLRPLEDLAGTRVEGFSPSETIEFMRARLASFLTTRFRARQSDISAQPGIQVRVETSTYGLRIHYSPAYFFNPTNILNAPSTPVLGWMQPGRYVFGASHPGQYPQFDFTAEYDIPSGDNKIILGI